MKAALAIIGGLALFLGLIFVLNLFGFGMDTFFKPRETALDNKVFQESQQYNDGMARDLSNMQMQWLDPHTTDPQKAAIRDTILHRYGGYNKSRLPPDLQAFYYQVAGAQ